MHKIKTKILTIALVAALVLGSMPAATVNAAAVVGEEAAVDEVVAVGEEAAVDEVVAVEEKTTEDETVVIEETQNIVETEPEEEVAVETEEKAKLGLEVPQAMAADMPEAQASLITLSATNFPDVAFREYLKQTYDDDNDNKIDPADVDEIDVSGRRISSLKGIEYFPELLYLNCEYNNLTSLDVSKNTYLLILLCDHNNITKLDVSKNVWLITLGLDYDKLTGTVDISNSPYCTTLDLYFQQIPMSATLDLSKIKGYQYADMSSVTYTIDSREPYDYYWGEVPTSNSSAYFYISTEGFVPALSSTGIYHASQTKDGIVAGLVTKGVNTSQVEYSWYVSKDGANWTQAQGWTKGNEWLSYRPSTYGDYLLVGKARYISNGVTQIAQSSSYFSYHPYIKGMCQMPYTGAGGGYLIGVESYDNPGQKYQYEMLILDCTLLAQGKPAWVYSTGKCGVSNGSAFWTVWQPQYGYYWTLFRVYDSKGNLIDETCYGFVNAY